MLRLVLSLISSMQVGARIKDTVEQSVRWAVVAAIALVVLLFAISFGLAAGYYALIGQGLTPLPPRASLPGRLACSASSCWCSLSRNRAPNSRTSSMNRQRASP